MFVEKYLAERSTESVESLSYEERVALWIFRICLGSSEPKKKQSLKHIFGKDFESLENSVSILNKEESLDISDRNISIKEKQFLSYLGTLQHGLSVALYNTDYRRALDSIANILGAYGFWLPSPQRGSFFQNSLRKEENFKLESSGIEFYSLAAE